MRLRTRRGGARRDFTLLFWMKFMFMFTFTFPSPSPSIIHSLFSFLPSILPSPLPFFTLNLTRTPSLPFSFFRHHHHHHLPPNFFSFLLFSSLLGLSISKFRNFFLFCVFFFNLHLVLVLIPPRLTPESRLVLFVSFLARQVVKGGKEKYSGVVWCGVNSNRHIRSSQGSEIGICVSVFFFFFQFFLLVVFERGGKLKLKLKLRLRVVVLSGVPSPSPSLTSLFLLLLNLPFSVSALYPRYYPLCLFSYTSSRHGSSRAKSSLVKSRKGGNSREKLSGEGRSEDVLQS